MNTNINLKYDESTIFNNSDIVTEINDVFNESDVEELIRMYDILNKWHIPIKLVKILGIPIYLYDYFPMLPISIKTRTITPLMKMLKKTLIERIKDYYLTQLDVKLTESQTWEEYLENECKDMGR